MTDANIQIILNRFSEIFEMNLEKDIGLWQSKRRRGEPIITGNRVMAVFIKSHKDVMQELCLTGCPYGEIWECKKEVS